MDIRYVRRGMRVRWHDPDGGLCSCVGKVVRVDRSDEVVTVGQPGGGLVEAMPDELTPATSADWWVGLEFDDDGHRARFRKRLMRYAAEFNRRKRASDGLVTPYWRSSFNDWLLYDCTLAVCGCVCVSRGDSTCVFEVEAAGCQEEGICVRATFAIPTKAFTARQLQEIVPGCGEYYPAVQTRNGLSFGPFSDTKFITKLEWWYDASSDERRSDR
jgi:hypothetical protein